jgi:hypothetical protein
VPPTSTPMVTPDAGSVSLEMSEDALVDMTTPDFSCTGQG